MTPTTHSVVYSCPFVPAEWIAAHGLRPRRVVPRSGAATPLPGVGIGMCPYAQAFAHEVRAAEGCAAVFTTACDQMRRVAELVQRQRHCPVFVLHVPATWQTVSAQRLYRDELVRMGAFLEGLSGQAPDPKHLANTMGKFNAARSRLRTARSAFTPRQYSEAVARFHRDGPEAVGELLQGVVHKQGTPKGPPLALVGAPLLAHEFELFDLVEATGGHVALDATTSGERTLPAPFDLRRLDDDPLGTLADAYFGAIPDAFRRPNSALYQGLKRDLAERGIRGIVFRRYLWCDTWHAEAQRMSEWADVPLLAIEVDDAARVNGHTVSRIQAFIETIR